MSALDILNNIIPISRFNKAQAKRIFEEVNHDGIKIVVNGNTPICVMLSPSEYEKLIANATAEKEGEK